MDCPGRATESAARPSRRRRSRIGRGASPGAVIEVETGTRAIPLWGSVGAAIVALALGCAAPKPKPAEPVKPGGATRTARYAARPIDVHKTVVETLEGLGETIEADRADGQFVQSASGERPDRSWIRTRVWISRHAEGGTLVTVRRSVVRRVSGHEVEWISLPVLPDASQEVLDVLDRRLERAAEPRR